MHWCVNFDDVICRNYTVNANDTKCYDFARFTEKEALEYIEEKGILLPNGLDKIEGYETLVKEIILESYKNEIYSPNFNSVELQKFAMDIVESVRKSAGKNTQDGENSNVTKWVLQHSTRHGSWNNLYLKYNCYGYAIGTQRGIDPGYYSGYSYDTSWEISEIASYVKKDLEALGYIVSVSTMRPVSLASGQNLICVRRGTYDYHFMKCSGVSWYHKPGDTNPLKYNYSSANYTIWDNESIRYETINEPTYTYSSKIYYITYSTQSGNNVGTASVVE